MEEPNERAEEDGVTSDRLRSKWPPRVEHEGDTQDEQLIGVQEVTTTTGRGSGGGGDEGVAGAEVYVEKTPGDETPARGRKEDESGRARSDDEEEGDTDEYVYVVVAKDAHWLLDVQTREEEGEEEEEEGEGQEEVSNSPRRGQGGPGYGELRAISAEEYVREVTWAPQGVRVLLLLCKEGVSICDLIVRHLSRLAVRRPEMRFLRILSTDCVPNYPDSHLPTVFMYTSGRLVGRLIGADQCGGEDVLEEELLHMLSSRVSGGEPGVEI